MPTYTELIEEGDARCRRNQKYKILPFYFHYYLVDEPDKVTGGRHHNSNEVKAGHYWVDRGHPETAP